jgi:hypothetical protein
MINASIQELLAAAAEKAQRRVENVGTRRVGPAEAELRRLSGFHEPFPQQPVDASEILAKLDHLVRLGLEDAGFEILNDVVINQVLVSFGRPEVTQEVIRHLQEEGTCWCGGTVWQGKTAMRISVSSWVTTEADVDRSLAAMIRIARESGAN